MNWRRKIVSFFIAILLFLTTMLSSLNLNLESVLARKVIFTDISSSYYYSLALKSDGSVWAWGNNQNGQLGDGSTVSSLNPIPIQTLPNTKAISAGKLHALALAQDGTVWSWGTYGYGQNFYRELVPKQVENLNGVIAIAAGYQYSLVLKEDGTVWAWGTNYTGVLGNGTNHTQEPIQVKNLRNIVSLDAGEQTAYAVESDGSVWAWGDNSYGQFGDGTRESSNLPEKIPGLTEVTAISSFGNTLALKRDGTVWTWGNNVLEKDLSFNDVLIPRIVESLKDVIAIKSGGNHNLAIKKDQSLWMWGLDTRLGEGPVLSTYEPRRMNVFPQVLAATAGAHYDLVIDNQGAIWGWGANENGELGDGTTQTQLIPIKSLVNTAPVEPRIENLSSQDSYGFIYNQDIEVLLNFSVRMETSSLTTDNITLLDEKGQSIPFELDVRDSKVVSLAPGKKLTPQTYTLKVSNLQDAYGNIMSETQIETFEVKLPTPAWSSPISAGAFHSQDRGSAWGDNRRGQLGDGRKAPSYIPIADKPLLSSVFVSSGGYHSLSLQYDGEVWAWGSNQYGQLGDGTTMDRSTPIRIPGLSGVVGLSGGDEFTLALKEDGTVWAWGRNNLGQLGDGTTTDRTRPTQVPGLSEIVYLAAGGQHSIAVKADGTVWTWGNNEYGQLGTGTTTDYEPLPTKIEGLKNIRAVAAGLEYGLALTDDGSVWSWGNNFYGQLGDGTQKSKDFPVQVQGLSSVSQIAAGYDFSLALDKGGGLWTWGDNTLSQLGVDSNEELKTTPVKVPSLDNVTAIAAGGAHALAQNNKLWGWGFNFTGQVGNGTAVHTSIPSEVEKNYYYGPRSYYRLSGNNRSETAIDIARAGWNYGTRAVVLTREDDFPDALTGTPLAYMLDAPILLTNPQTLSPETKAAIEELQPTDIYILGMSGAVSEEIERQLGQSYNVKRLGGKDRYETAAKIAQHMEEEGFLDTEKAIIAYGGNFPDALAISSLAAFRHIPILLTETNTLPDSTKGALHDLGVNETILVGGTGVVSLDIEEAVPKPTRYSGADRYMTALEIASTMYSGANTVFLATGENFPDALAGSVLAARTNSPILLVDRTLPTSTARYLRRYNQDILEIMVLGGPGVVSDEVIGEIEGRLEYYAHFSDDPF